VPENEVAEADASAERGGAPARADAPYRAAAARDGSRWHLTVESLDDHPDRGEVDSLVVTVTPRAPGEDFPAAEIDRTLRQCGFARDGDWTPDGERWTAPFRQPDPGAAPPAPA
jgi:hypothetical protein